MSALDLRLIVITDHQLAAPRPIEAVVRECLAAGAPAIQLRDKQASARDLLEQALRLRELTSEYGALLFINDRLDVAIAARADGVHLGPDDVPIAAVRRVAPEAMLLGFSTDQPDSARDAERNGAAYIGCGAVFGTTSKAEVAGEQIGPDGLRRIVNSISLPVIGIGGITPVNVHEVAAAGAAGCAVIRALMSAERPGAVTRSLLAAFAD